MKKAKKIALTTLICLTAIFSVLGFSSCQFLIGLGFGAGMGDLFGCKHTYETEITAPTCTDLGYTTYTCACGDSYKDDYVSALGHTEVVDKAVAPTCTETGLTEGKHCEVCSTVLVKQGVIEATGHSYKDKICETCHQEYYSEGLKYTLNSDGTSYSVAGIGSCEDTEIVIPSTYENLPVTKIGDYAFLGCISLTSVKIGDSVQSIGYNAFNGCCKLVEVYNKSSLTITAGNEDNGYVGYYAKAIYTEPYISKLSTDENGYIIYTDGDDKILIGYTSTETDLILPQSITEVYQYAFAYCDSLTSIEIPDSIHSIGDYAFYWCTNLTSVVIPGSVQSIGAGAFYWCTSLTSVEIGNGVQLIMDSAFMYCSSLTSVEIGNGVQFIGNSVFYDCDSLTSIEIPDSVQSIGVWAFFNCDSLTSVVIPDSMQSIGYNAFNGCCKLVEVYNKSSLTITAGNEDNGYVGYYAKAIYTEPYISKLSTDENGYIIYTDGDDKILIGYTSTEMDLILPESITEVYQYAFAYCDSLTSVVIPDSVQSIGNYAFYNCTSLTSIEIPDSVQSIGNYAFLGCISLTSIEIPDSVQSIGNYAFLGCRKLVEVYNKSSLTITAGNEDNGYVGYYAKNIYTPTSGQSKLSTDENGYIIYTDGEDKILIEYTGTETDLILPENITEVYQYAFSSCTSLTNVVIPDSVQSIGDYAFYWCTNLTSVKIGDGVQSIGDDAFYDCDSLTSVKIGDSVQSIGGDAFAYCDSLTSIEIPDSVQSIGSYAFNGCTSLISIAFNDTSTWYRTYDYDDWGNKTGGEQVDVTKSDDNAKYFKDIYENYYWYKL